MKKIFFALAALVLAFTGCSQEEDAIQVSEKKAIKVVVNMDKPGFGEDTRAARQDWEAGDVVAVMLVGDLQNLILLRYNGTSWQVKVMYLHVDTFLPMTADDQTDYLADLTSGNLKAIYCSSGFIRARAFLEGEALKGIDIISNARNNGYDLDPSTFISTPYGECIMTCEGGTYMKDGDLTLNITMIPQVAQFTIKNLSDGEDEEEGKTSEGYEVGVENLIAYCGGTITSSGITLNQVDDAGDYNACWVHPNTDGISIYAAVDSEYEPVVSKNFIQFRISDDLNYLWRNFESYADYKAKVTNGAAIIMNGPADGSGGNGWALYY